MVKCALAGKGTACKCETKLKNWHIRGVCLPASTFFLSKHDRSDQSHFSSKRSRL